MWNVSFTVICIHCNPALFIPSLNCQFVLSLFHQMSSISFTNVQMRNPDVFHLVTNQQTASWQLTFVRFFFRIKLPPQPVLVVAFFRAILLSWDRNYRVAVRIRRGRRTQSWPEGTLLDTRHINKRNREWCGFRNVSARWLIVCAKILIAVVLFIDSFLSSFLQAFISRVISLRQANISRLGLRLEQDTQGLVRFRELKFIGLNVRCRLLYAGKRVIALSQANIYISLKSPLYG